MDGRTQVCGLIGNPVEHSMSPMMHNLYSERAGYNQTYVPFLVDKEEVGEAVKGAFALHIKGLNVTVPHKQAVMEYLTDIDEDARVIGAVNTLVREEQGYKGYNTDAAGLSRAFAENGISIEGEDCILLGAGGAAKAAAYVLAKEGAKRIYLLNRSSRKTQTLAKLINTWKEAEVVIPMKLEDYGKLPWKEKGYLAVQSTSVGMYPHGDDVIISDPRFYRLIHSALDIVYTPACTRFMQMVKEAGGRAVNGLDMLLYQGVIAYELWNPEVKVDRETILEAKNRILEQLLKGKAPELKNNLILTGFMGAGKTSVGKYYAKNYHKTFLDTDAEIEKAAGMSIPDIFKTQGEAAFRRLETDTLKRLLETAEDCVISTGGGLPLREENQVLLKKLGTVVYLSASPETVYERIGADVSDRPMLQGGDVKAKIAELLKMRAPVYQRSAHLEISVNGRNLEEIAGDIHEKAAQNKKI